MPSAQDILGPDGPLARSLPGYAPRATQALMADAVTDALDERSVLIVEAGTGTGKTFAYLAPALISNRRVLVSTGTRALQDQLFHRDLPVLARSIGRPCRVALLKGRANYLCLERLGDAREQAGATAFARELAIIEAWASTTSSGDRREVSDVAETSRVWPRVTSTVENCLGSRCPLYEQCFVVRARREAQQADVVVVNHHLLLADLAMKESGFDQFLPGVDAFILDEAHQLPDIAGQFFGERFGQRALAGLIDETEVAAAGGGSALQGALAGVRQALADFRLAAPTAPGRYDWDDAGRRVVPALERLREAVDTLYEHVSPLTELSVALESVGNRLFDQLAILARFANGDATDGLTWIEVGKSSVALNRTPLDVSGTLGGMIAGRDAAWILTSATLAVGEDFSHFAERVGVPDARTVLLASPYDLENRARVYLPAGMPDPASDGYTECVMQSVAALTRQSNGGVFVLFTSHRALGLAATWASTNRRRLGRELLLVQGTAPRDELLVRFRAQANAILLGTGTFWEGVDVRGDALVIVAIDKLPFASPADPLVRARLKFLAGLGENGFVMHQLPQAVLTLKQGAGRLLRDEADYGIIVLFDPRITSKAYGKRFLEALHPMPVVRDEGEAVRFLERCAAASGDDDRPV